VYTVWLVKMAKPMAKEKAEMKGAAMSMMGVGKAPYVLPVDSKGYAKFTASVADCRSVVMQKLEIVEHPSKNAKDMKNIVPVFTADMSQMQQGEMLKMLGRSARGRRQAPPSPTPEGS
jgi:hypothetical protein